VACDVLGEWADIEHHHVAAAHPFDELRPVDGVEFRAVAEIGLCQLVQAGQVLLGDGPHRGPHLLDPLAAQRVEDAGAVAAGGDHAGAREGAQVVGGVGHALPDLVGDLLDGTLALGEQVDDLGSATGPQGTGHLGKCRKQCILRRPIAHLLILRSCQLPVKFIQVLDKAGRSEHVQVAT
jgi:hypothetical protein